MSVPFLEALVTLNTDLNPLRKGLNDAEREAKNAGAGIERAFGGLKTGLLAVGGIIGVGSIGALVTSTLNLADSLDAASNRLGINVEALQREKFAAEQLGVEFGALEVGLKEFLKRLGDLQTKGDSDLGPALKRLGISTRDANGAQREGIDVYSEFLTKLADVTSNTERLSIAQAAAGRSGAAFAQIAAAGADELDRLREAAPILSAEDVATLDEAGDLIERISLEVKVLAGEGLVALKQAIEALTGGGSASTQLARLDDEIRQVTDSLDNLRTAQAEGRNLSGGGDVLAFLGVGNEQLIQGTEANLRRLLALREELVAKVPKPRGSGGGSGLLGIDDETVKQTQELLSKLDEALLQSEENKIGLAQKSRDDSLRLIEETIKDEEQAAEAKLRVQEIYANQVKAIFRDIAEAEASEQQAIRREIEQTIREQEQDAKRAAREVERLGEDIGGALTDVVLGGKEGFRDLLLSFRNDFIEQALTELAGLALAQAAVSSGAVTKAGGGLGGIAASAVVGLAGKAFAGFFDSGGDIPAGSFGVVGERRAEIVSGPATVTPIQSGGSGTVVQVINATPAQVQVREQPQADGRALIRVVIGEVAADIANGGVVGQTMQKAFEGLRPRLAR